MNSRARLKELLNELFRIESSDLDFGIYRIMNKKREEINNFIENNLDKYIDKALMSLSETKKKELEEKLQRIKEGLDIFGVSDYSVSDDYKNVIKELEKYDLEKYDSTNSIDEIDIYEHIYNFFKRYYDNGDFISQMRYSRENKYTVPYNGEEVYLYWANKDQYYVKTSENFIKYSFEKKSIGVKVEFKVNNAELDKNNIKSDEKRYFVLHEDFFEYKKEEKILNIYFEYRALTEEEKQKYKKQNTQNDINKYIFEEIKRAVGKEELANLSWLFERTDHSNKTILEKHIYKYTKKNKSDYFIHKDLKGFLNRELDFYIKNEILDFDTLKSEQIEDVKKLFKRIDIFRDVCKKIITFLDSIENFQKKLFKKKKFVLQTEYCLTLDKVPEDIRDDIFNEVLSNQRQLKEWKILYHEDIKSIEDLYYSENNALDKKKLKNLVIDTKFFNEEFKEKLLSSFEDIDEQTDGLLIHSENYQALNLLQRKYKGKIDVSYIDPPYNAKSSEILYKNNFKHSSWLSLMYDRLSLSKKLMHDKSVQIIAIDENEQERLGLLIDNIFNGWEKSCVTIVHNPAGIQGNNFSYTHEYAYFIFPEGKTVIGKTIRDKDLVSPLRDWGGTSDRNLAQNCFYPILVKNNQIIGFGEVCDDDFHPGSSHIKVGDITYVYPIDKHGIERKWVFSRKTVEERADELFVEIQDGKPEIMRRKSERSYYTVWDDKKYYANIYGSRLLSNMFGELNFSFPKSIYTVQDCLWATLPMRELNAIALDFFAGSGTTAHAVINLNKKDNGNRKYILIEMGDYFDTVLKPRIQKVVFSDDWKDGKPQNYNGHSHMFKYILIEQYEDSLRNIRYSKETESESFQMKMEDYFEDYLIRYMLDYETQESLLNIEKFKTPFDYEIELENENKDMAKVDLVETFNYLMGINVEKLRVYNHQNRKYKIVIGKLNEQKVLVIWRNVVDLDMEEDKRFIEEEIIGENKFDKIYINCDNYVEGSLLIEEQFYKLMFEE